REAEKAIALVEETEGIGPLEISLTLDEIEELDEKRRKLASFCDEIHYEISQMVDRPFTARIAELLEEAYALDPSDFKAETAGATYNHMISLKDLMMATTIDEQLKKDFDSKFNTLDQDKPSRDLKDAIREARNLEEKMIMQKTMSFVLNMPLMRALKGIYRIIKSGIEGMLGQGFDPDKDYATLIANAIKEGDYSNLQKYVNERDAKLASDKEKYKDAQTTGAYLISLGYVSVREYLNRKGFKDDQITYENGKVCVTVNGKKYPLDIEGIALTGHTNYASEENIEKAIEIAKVPQVAKSLVSQQEIDRFVNNYNKNNTPPLTDIQIQALNKINDYSGNEIITNLDPDEPIILFFEGAGNFSGKKHLSEEPKGNEPHINGRFGAMAVVIKNGKIIYMSLNASTLPDTPQAQYAEGSKGHSTVIPGVYYIKSDYAGANQKHVGFATGTSPNPQQKKGDEIPVYRFYDINGEYKPGVYDADSNAPGAGCDIHAGWDTPASNSSTGCLVIKDFHGFMDAIGLNKGLPNPNSARKENQYINQNGKRILVDLPEITGAAVIDRILADPNYLKGMYDTEDAVDIIMGVKNKW
ncbi:MAG: hypothetical protein ACOYIF_12080, partial [Acetivibrionales bacterium]